MAEAIATQSWDSADFYSMVDCQHFSNTLIGIRQVGDAPGLIYLSKGSLAFNVHGRQIFASAPALIQVLGNELIKATPLQTATGKYWTFKSSYNDALRDSEELTVTPFKIALDAARIGGLPITIAQTRYGRLAIADEPPSDEWECLERFHGNDNVPASEAPEGLLLWSNHATTWPDDRDCVDLAIIGTGPTGLSVAAWAQELGLSYCIFGEPLAFWKRHIAPLPLRSPPASTNISTPRQGYRFVDFAQQHVIDTEKSVSMAAFLAYASWFSGHHGIQPQPSFVDRLHATGDHWSLQHTDGRIRARNVVVSVGLQTMQRQPAGLQAITPHWSFVSDILDFSPFAGKNIAVLGGGQSAIEAALLASRAGANVTLVIRRSAIHYRCLHTPSEWVYRNLFKQSKRFIAYLPGRLQDRLLRYLLEGTVETSLEEIVTAANIPILTQARVDARSVDDPRPAVFQLQGAPFHVDHVLVAAGYDYDVHRLPFLSSTTLRQRGGLPLLDRYAMSSAAGLFFSGISTARRFGPQSQFVFGTGIVSPRIMQGVKRRIRT